ncbi:hypothetical protein [Mangrovibacterium diazotrophicum]|uniref:PH (Pleckstrin Homology) domain-containing protein n=1 Tax=Mangrovibacterium diazotrophicum TaxID=1261403 RepID=A0A419VVC9_9BACT|nr:hypothetical protein [Mangrovibacterium diazotrophicum]RKD86107.1 hypothetical protein BC643_4423 [Mangrovibacterium diazotrophicum]
MEISNKKRTTKIKRTFNFSMVALLLLTLFFVWKENNVGALISGGILVLCVMAVQFVQINYIYYSSEGNKILIRYYPLIAFFGKEYNSIEFDKHLLYFAKVKRIAAFSDLYIAIKTAKGIAEYPEVSLVGLSKDEIGLIENDLNALLKK